MGPARVIWWLIIKTPQAVHCWNIGNPDDLGRDDLLDRARVASGFPASDDWISNGSGYDLQITYGEPHPSLLERATVGTVADLSKVDAELVAQHADARRAAVEVRGG
jgi:hypothetical protein